MSTTGTGGPKSNTTQRRGMALRDIGEINGDLAVIVGAIGPTSFFENLRLVDSKDRTAFLNDFGEVVFFPDRITITLFIIGPIPREHGRTSGFDTQYMNELKFKAEWKRGIELRPVKTQTFHYFFVLDVLSPKLAINNSPSAASSGSIFIADSRFCLISETTRK